MGRGGQEKECKGKEEGEGRIKDRRGGEQRKEKRKKNFQRCPSQKRV